MESREKNAEIFYPEGGQKCSWGGLKIFGMHRSKFKCIEAGKIGEQYMKGSFF